MIFFYMSLTVYELLIVGVQIKPEDKDRPAMPFEFITTFLMYIYSALLPHAGCFYFLNRATQRCKRRAAEKEKEKSFDKIVKSARCFDSRLHREHMECAICMETFAEQTKKVVIAPCDVRHFFHAKCMQEWMARHTSCPFCKHRFTLDELISYNTALTSAQISVKVRAIEERDLESQQSTTSSYQMVEM